MTMWCVVRVWGIACGSSQKRTYTPMKASPALAIRGLDAMDDLCRSVRKLYRKRSGSDNPCLFGRFRLAACGLLNTCAGRKDNSAFRSFMGTNTCLRSEEHTSELQS